MGLKRNIFNQQIQKIKLVKIFYHFFKQQFFQKMMSKKFLMILFWFAVVNCSLKIASPQPNSTEKNTEISKQHDEAENESRLNARKLQFAPWAAAPVPYQPGGIFQPAPYQPYVLPPGGSIPINQPGIFPQNFSPQFSPMVSQQRAPTGKIHSFRLTPSYAPDILNSVNYKKISTIFGVAATYFFNIIKVRYLDPSQVIYRTPTPQCWPISSSYSQRGFDQNYTDTIVGVGSATSSSNGLLAWATPCYVSRRVVYGVIMFNQMAMGTSFLALHNTVQVAIHELTHMLGFSFSLYGRYFTSPSSSTMRPYNSVIRNIRGRVYIVTPKVVEYVKKYFGCTDGTGALLAGQENPSHWDKWVYQNQYMTPSMQVPGSRLSRLTLALLADTGYYESVREVLSQPTRWGFQKGCSFARGQLAPQPCYPGTCDYYNRYVQAGCNTQSDNHIRGQYCQDEAEGAGSEFNAYTQSRPKTTPSYLNSFKYYGHMSRCFQLPNMYGPRTSCYKAGCTSKGVIVIEVGGVRGNCTVPNRQVVINRVSITCPRNFDVFCSYKGCKSFCQGRGICINSRCLCSSPYKGVDCGG